MTQLDTYLPPWLRDLLPENDPAIVAGLTLLAVFLWLRIGALVIALARARRTASADGSPPSPGIQSRDCIWEPDSRPAPWGKTRWRCATCGGVEFTQDGHAPQICKRRH